MQIREAHCPRCDRNVTALVAWRGFVWAKFAWYACLLVMCALMPIILSDLFVLIPLAVLFTFAAGPVHFLAAEKDSCRECGLSIERT